MTLYEILGIEPSADEKEIKKAHREKSKEHHPDKGGDPLLFREVQEAYEVLIDPHSRNIYDTDGVIITERPEALQEWVANMYKQMVKTWLTHHVNSTPNIPVFEQFVEGNLGRVLEQARANIADFERKLERLNEKRDFASVDDEGDNVFDSVIDGMEDELRGGLKTAHLEVYRAGLLREEFERYEFTTQYSPQATVVFHIGSGGNTQTQGTGGFF